MDRIAGYRIIARRADIPAADAISPHSLRRHRVVTASLSNDWARFGGPEMSTYQRPGVKPVRSEEDGELHCTACDLWNGTHVDEVRIAARAEDRDFNETKVDAITGRVTTHNDAPSPVGPLIGQGRRQRIMLLGWCELYSRGYEWVYVRCP
ncbi:hypothetical protein [Tenggerimyces flavus]|uniref:Uncharacterized protein n=1 Tax=Tenggerimyces flavus TaxID=1708749 RepID=A0ABV7YCK1_9ACTN|nr:hypothetical protein [Tenggerimyces flavus]MBM7790275.1 hypothetical protein [Tenggerimyces flavus]